MPNPEQGGLRPEQQDESVEMNYDILDNGKISITGNNFEALVDAGIQIAEGLGQHLLLGEIDALIAYQSVEIGDDYFLEMINDNTLIVMASDPEDEILQREMEEVVDNIIGT